jgi:hypothetical protein
MVTVDKSDVRFIQVEGRGTTMPATSLDFSEQTGRSVLGTMGRGSAAKDGWIQQVVSIVKMYPQGINESTLYAKLTERGHPKNKIAATEVIKEAAEGGFIKREKAAPTGRGGRAPMMHWPTEDHAPDDDRTRKATPVEVDLRDVRVRSRRRADV